MTLRALNSLFAIIVALTCTELASADSVYRHKDANGNMVFSDLPAGAGIARTAYLTDFGRKPATASCAGLSAAALDARAAHWRPKIASVARQYDLDTELLLALVRVESCFDTRAHSRAGARGLTQLMPNTARALGVVDSFNAEANLDGGARYLARMLTRFGDEHLALAAYNAGPGNVEKYGGVPPFPETQNYLRRINALR